MFLGQQAEVSQCKGNVRQYVSALRTSPFALHAFGVGETWHFPHQSRTPVLVDGPSVLLRTLTSAAIPSRGPGVISCVYIVA